MLSEQSDPPQQPPTFSVWVTDSALQATIGKDQQNDHSNANEPIGRKIVMQPSAEYLSGVDQLPAGIAPVRRQYQKVTSKPSRLESTEEVKRDRDQVDSTPETTNLPTKLKRSKPDEADVVTIVQETGDRPFLKKKERQRRGQNKNRKEEMKQFRGETKGNALCKALIISGECTKGDACPYLHDRQVYLASKTPDLGERCVHFDTFGRCPYDIACRFHKAHTDAQGQPIVNEALANNPPINTLNKLTQDYTFAIRKRQVETPRSETFIRVMHREMDRNRKQQECITKEKNQAGSPADEPASFTAPVAESTSPEQLADTDALLRLAPREKKRLDFRDKLYLAPLTTVGNLPFRRLCKEFGVDITCGEMAMAINLVQGQKTEFSHLKRHVSEDFFGVQLCGCKPEVMARAAEMINSQFQVDFVDINLGCPIDAVYKSGAGSGLLESPNKLRRMVQGLDYVLDCPVTVKIRTGIYPHNLVAHKLLPKFELWNCALATLHGRTRAQRYTRLADWDYVGKCQQSVDRMPLFGNGDILSWSDYYEKKEHSGVAGIMIGRGALIKPWLFEEIKQRRDWDISSRERLDILRKYCSYGLEHWGSDDLGINQTRRFLCEWMSFLCRYIPVGLLEVLPQKINERPPPFYGRDELETLMSSSDSQDWVKISEILLGPAPESFKFIPKHKSNSYEVQG
ncbi:tRNA-dihydrouridine(47) synthase [NAD(P)(+)]-like protein [Dispira simplex]|nr:tRNA-dihydrouridine(47) synthase [NAD(P)(+)]-like protein [Dispira simplex]